MHFHELSKEPSSVMEIRIKKCRLSYNLLYLFTDTSGTTSYAIHYTGTALLQAVMPPVATL